MPDGKKAVGLHRRPEVQRLGSGRHELGDNRAVLLVQVAPSHMRDAPRLGYSRGWVPAEMGLRPSFATRAGIP
jgi:hypothetical protein